MPTITARSDDADEYVSMHHRIRKGIRKRLKHAAADLEKPVTDIVNEAILAHLDRLGVGAASLNDMPGKKVIEALRAARSSGSFYGTASALDKAKLVEVSRMLGEAADLRSSGDRLISRIAAALAEE